MVVRPCLTAARGGGHSSSPQAPSPVRAQRSCGCHSRASLLRLRTISGSQMIECRSPSCLLGCRAAPAVHPHRHCINGGQDQSGLNDVTRDATCEKEGYPVLFFKAEVAVLHRTVSLRRPWWCHQHSEETGLLQRSCPSSSTASQATGASWRVRCQLPCFFARQSHCWPLTQ